MSTSSFSDNSNRYFLRKYPTDNRFKVATRNFQICTQDLKTAGCSKCSKGDSKMKKMSTVDINGKIKENKSDKSNYNTILIIQN